MKNKINIQQIKENLNQAKSAFEKWSELEQEDKSLTGRIPSFLGKFELDGKALDFDKDVLAGGYFRGVPAIISGFPNHGKTSLSIQQAVLQAERGYRVLYLTFEQGEIEIIEKALGILAEKHYQIFEEIKYIENIDEFAKRKEEAKKLLFAYLGHNFKVLKLSIHVKEFPYYVKNIIKEDLYDVCYVDNIQNLNYDEKERTTQFDILTNKTRLLMEGSRLVLIWLSQLTSSGPKKDPKTASPKWCNKINEDASTWIVIHRKEKTDDEKKNTPEDITKSYIDVKKNRKGTSGINFEDGAFVYDTIKERIGSFSYSFDKLEERLKQREQEEQDRKLKEEGKDDFDAMEEANKKIEKDIEKNKVKLNKTVEIDEDDLVENDLEEEEEYDYSKLT